MKLVTEAVFEICTAESLENQLHNNKNLTPMKYNEVIRLKAVVPEISMKIGAIIRKGVIQKMLKDLGQFGRIYGINSIIVEEFADL